MARNDTIASLSLECFTAVFGIETAARLALLLHGEVYRRFIQGFTHMVERQATAERTGPVSAPGSPDKAEKQYTSHASSNFEGCMMASTQMPREIAQQTDEPPPQEFFMIYGKRTRRVLSAPARHHHVQHATTLPVEEEGALRDAQRHCGPTLDKHCARTSSALALRRAHSQDARSHASPQCALSQAKTGPGNRSSVWPKAQCLACLDDMASTQQSRSARVMARMAEKVQGPIAADFLHKHGEELVTDELRLEVAAGWGVPVLSVLDEEHDASTSKGDCS
jgi:hypothetical protein